MVASSERRIPSDADLIRARAELRAVTGLALGIAQNVVWRARLATLDVDAVLDVLHERLLDRAATTGG